MRVLVNVATNIQNANEKAAQPEILEISRIFFNPDDGTVCLLHDNNVCPMIYAAPLYRHEYNDLMDDIMSTDSAKIFKIRNEVFMTYPADKPAQSAPYREVMLKALRESSHHRPSR